jgi:hypothetical protein
MVGRQFLLTGIAVRHPDFGTVIAQDLFRHRLGPAWRDLVQDGPIGEEGPSEPAGEGSALRSNGCQQTPEGPVGDAVDPGRRLVRGDDRRIRESGLDPAAQLVEWLGHPAEGIGDGALGDRHPEQLGQKPAQPFEADMVGVVQIEQKRMNVRAERRPCRHAIGRLRLEPPAATATEQLDPDDLGGQERNVDAVVAMPADLPLSRDIAAAMPAGRRPLLHDPIRTLDQSARAARTRRTLLAPLAGRTVGLLIPRRRMMRILRRPWRPAASRSQRLLQLTDANLERVDHPRLIQNQLLEFLARKMR